jgi:predicted transcriptional regulator
MPVSGCRVHLHGDDGIMRIMTKLLEKAVEKLLQLPEGRQDELARMLIDVAASDLHPYQLTDEERAAVDEGLAQAERGEFATDKEVAAMWQRFGL